MMPDSVRCVVVALVLAPTAWAWVGAPPAAHSRAQLRFGVRGSLPLCTRTSGLRRCTMSLGGPDTEFDMELAAGNAKRALDLLRKSGTKLAVDGERAEDLISVVGNACLASAEEGLATGTMTAATAVTEDDLSFVYQELHNRGLLKGYGSVTMDVVPYRNKDVTPAKLEELTGLNMQALAPGGSDNAWAYAGAALCLAEVAASQYYGIDPLQGLLPVTIGIFAVDRIVLKGAAFESLARFVNPTYKEKIVRHEAGHLLLAYLLGCPVSGCLLDPWQVRKFIRGQGGTVFADPTFARGLESGSISKSAVDRFSVILMGGIAAEAIHFGKADGGASDEGALIEVLSALQPPFTYEMIRLQARWAAVQAALLLREHQAAYDALLAALDGGASLGECIMAIEKQLRLMPSPTSVEQRRQALAAAAGATLGTTTESAELRRMLEAQIKQKDAQKAMEDNMRVASELSARLKRLMAATDEQDAAAALPDASEANGPGEGWLLGLNAVKGAAAAADGNGASLAAKARVDSAADEATTKDAARDTKEDVATIEARLREVEARLRELSGSQD